MVQEVPSEWGAPSTRVFGRRQGRWIHTFNTAYDQKNALDLIFVANDGKVDDGESI